MTNKEQLITDYSILRMINEMEQLKVLYDLIQPIQPFSVWVAEIQKKAYFEYIKKDRK
jgi:hypothetical protein